jgi:hypothetical protein
MSESFVAIFICKERKTMDFDITSIDMTQTLPEHITSMMNGGGILLVSVALVLGAIFFIRYKARIVPLLLGLLAYAAFIFIGSNLVINLLPDFVSTTSLVSGVEIWVKSLILVVFFMLARVCVVGIMGTKYGNPGDVMIAGLGLGVGDAIVYGVTMVISLGVLATSIGQFGMEEILLGNDLSADQALELYINSISPMLHAPVVTWLLMGISLCMDMVLNVGFMMLTWGVVQGKLTRDWYLITAGLNFVIMLPYTFNAIYYTSLVRVLVMFGIKAVLFAAIAAVIYKVDEYQLGSMLKADLRGFKYEKMPHFGNLRKR